MKILQNLASSLGLTVFVYIATFLLVIIGSANEFGGQGNPGWLDTLTYFLMGVSGLLTLWVLVLFIKKMANKV